MKRPLARLRCLLGRHAWEGCACAICGRARHVWRHVADPDAVIGPVSSFMDEMAYYRQRCDRCGEWKK
ncbi:MAG: hypothetical protein P8129_11215 [Anaerolineae bacterium]|jgi:hypothetical protein